MNETKKLALLIDSDNVSPKYAQFIVEEASKHGELIYKRIYGDWEKNNSGWRIPAMNNSIMPIQQNSYIAGKNSTDFSIIIDAMDILYTGRVDGFVLVTSDSDFTRLAIRLRESGMLVIGIGEVKTPLAFTSSCHEFCYLNQTGENLGEYDEEILRKAVVDFVCENDDGTLDLTKINAYLTSSYGNIDYDKLGFKRFSAFIDSLPELERKGVFVSLRKLPKDPPKISNSNGDEKLIVSVISNYLSAQENHRDIVTKVLNHLIKTIGRVDFSRFGSKRFSKFIDNHSEFKRKNNYIYLNEVQSEANPDICKLEPAPIPKQENKSESKPVLRISNQLFAMEVKKYAEENGEKGGNLGQLNNMLLEKYGKNYIADMGFSDFAEALGSVKGVKIQRNFVAIDPPPAPVEHVEEKPAPEESSKKKVGRPKKTESPRVELNSVKRDLFEYITEHDNAANVAACGGYLSKKYGKNYLSELGYKALKLLLADIKEMTCKNETLSLKKTFITRTKKIEKFIYDFAGNDETKSIKALTMQLKKKFKDFDFTDYGYTRLRDYINAIDGVCAKGYYVQRVENADNSED